LKRDAGAVDLVETELLAEFVRAKCVDVNRSYQGIDDVQQMTSREKE
jgi:hypothetical protein